MDLENLVTFCTVAHHKSFKKAAETLQVTQPGISRRIQSLETELGTPLFVRTPQSVTLTKAGKSFLPYAERTIQIFKEGKNKISDEVHEEKLVIASPPTTSVNLLPEVIKEFCLHHSTRLSLYTAHSQHVYDMLIDKTIDVGFTTVAFPNSHLDYELIYMEEVVCVGHPDLVKQYIVDHEIIKHPVPVILSNLNNINIDPWESINQYFLNHPSFEVVLDAFFLQVVENLARIGVGLAVLPISHVNEGIKRGELVKVLLPEIDLPSRPVYMATYKNGKMEKSIHQFKTTAKRVLTKNLLL